jgi:hypothetical protein
MLKGGLEGLPKPGELRKIIEEKRVGKDEVKEIKEKAKGLLKGLPFGK